MALIWERFGEAAGISLLKLTQERKLTDQTEELDYHQLRRRHQQIFELFVPRSRKVEILRDDEPVSNCPNRV
jgi:hypothetical protein